MAQFPSTTSASDVWNMTDVYRAKAGGNWPSPAAPRTFTISPAVSGKTTWDLDVDGPLTLSTYGDWTITTTATFNASVKIWGAGGGQGPSKSSFQTSPGGAGGFAGGTVAFPASSTLKARVGQGGLPTPASAGGSGTAFGGGGQAYNYSDGNWNGASGGGLAGLFLTSVTQGNSILVAGAGGGGGCAQSASASGGGAGGGSTGGTGVGGSGGGGGGTQSAGGAAASNTGGIGTGVAGSALQGGSQTSSNTMGGGGGGGYFGGGTGIYTSADIASGGGGGSGYYNATYVSSATLTAGSGTTPGNSGDAYRGTAGNPGNTGLNGAAQSGVDGKIVII